MSSPYAKYIGYFIQYIGQSISKTEWRTLLRSQLGTSFNKITETDMSKFAIMLYYAHYASLISKITHLELIKILKTSSKIKEFLLANEELRESYNLPSLQVVYYTNVNKIRKHMESFGGNISTIKDLMIPKTKPKTKAIPKTKTRAKAISKAKKGELCSNYTVLKLRQLATKKNIKGRSKMNKVQLCKALGIKI